jgi:DNA mismatch repair protein MutS
MRRVGLIVILAQAGCMVCAAFALLGVADRILAQVGTVDGVALGHSTLQAEAAETTSILSQATPQSLILLDEIGCGTAVADGIAIAWAVAVHMAGASLGGGCLSRTRSADAEVPRTMLVTEDDELNELAVLSAVETFRMQTVHSSLQCAMDRAGPRVVQEGDEEEWVVTHRIVPGPSWNSHGLAIAERAGFPSAVIARAEQVVVSLRAPQ